MKYINTLTNSFVLGEKDDNGRILEQFGFPKGGLTYLIKGVNVKFYLVEDYFYKNVIWSADAPLMIDGVLISVDNLPIALKKIFHQEAEEIAIDTEFDTESFNAIANAPVSVRFNEIEASQGVISDKVDTLSGEVQTKASEADLTAHTADSNIHVTTGEKESWNSKAEISDIPDVSNFIEMSAVTDYTYSKSVIDEKIENVEVDAYTKTESDERFQPIGDYLSGNALNGYATEQWVGEQGYLTEHQDISGKQDVSGMTAYTTTATTDALNGVVTAHTADTTIHVTSADKSAWNAKSDFSGSYNDLTDKPSIPSTGDIQTQIDSSISGKQDTLSAGTGISIVGNVISATGGGGGGNNVVELTQAEYSALTTIDPTTIYVITDAEEINANEYVAKVSNIASGYTDVITPKSSYSYSEAFNDTVYWNAGTYTGSSSSRQIGSAIVYTSQYGSTTIFLAAGISNGVVTANTTKNNQYLTIEVVDGELAVTPNEGYYWCELRDNNSGSHNIKKHYSSGQSKNVIENTIYDVLDTRREQIENLRTNMVTDVTASVSDGELRVSEIKTNGSGVSTVILKSSTINYDNGLNVQFSSTTEGQKVLNTGSNAYYDLFNAGYDTTKSYHDLTIVMNSGYTGSYAEPTFSFYFLTSDGTTRSSDLSFAYNVANNSISWLNEGWGTYVTVTDTLSTDYTIKFTANDGYLISFFNSNNGLIGGVDATRPYEFVTNLITTTSYIHPGQDIIDDLYANKQDTLSAGTGISIVDNVISATGGGGANVVQTTGTSTTDVMSQDAVTTQLNGKQVSESNGYFYDVTTSYQSTNSKSTDYIRLKSRKNDGSSVNVTKLYFPRINGNKLVQSSVYYTNFEFVETSAITTSITSSSTDAQVPSAKAVNDKLGGLSLVKLTQSEYDALSPNYDANTIYFIKD